jgi:hypothetical protein
LYISVHTYALKIFPNLFILKRGNIPFKKDVLAVVALIVDMV